MITLYTAVRDPTYRFAHTDYTHMGNDVVFFQEEKISMVCEVPREQIHYYKKKKNNNNLALLAELSDCVALCQRLKRSRAVYTR